jgi:rRNA-processing protein FCF1
MEVLLDSSFILSCVKKGIDFISQLEEQGFVVKVPNEVIEELKDLRLETRHIEREAIAIALTLFEQRSVKKIKLGNKKVDQGLIEYGKKGYYIATLDRAIKRSVPHSVVIFDAQKKVGIDTSF